jgi:hypothetical protein
VFFPFFFVYFQTIGANVVMTFVSVNTEKNLFFFKISYAPSVPLYSDGLYITKIFLRFEVLTAMTMQISMFWDVTPCSQAAVYQHFIETCCLHS